MTRLLLHTTNDRLWRDAPISPQRHILDLLVLLRREIRKRGRADRERADRHGRALLRMGEHGPDQNQERDHDAQRPAEHAVRPPGVAAARAVLLLRVLSDVENEQAGDDGRGEELDLKRPREREEAGVLRKFVRRAV